MWPNNINTLQWISHVEMVLGSYINIQVNIPCSCLTAMGMKPVPPNTDLVEEFSGHHWMSVKFRVWPQKNNVWCKSFFFFLKIVWEVDIKRHICMLLFSSDEGTWWDLRKVEVWMWWVCGGGWGWSYCSRRADGTWNYWGFSLFVKWAEEWHFTCCVFVFRDCLQTPLQKSFLYNQNPLIHCVIPPFFWRLTSCSIPSFKSSSCKILKWTFFWIHIASMI